MEEKEENLRDKALYGEEEKSAEEKKLLEKQKEFEYSQIINKGELQRQEEKETKRSRFFSWIIVGLAILFLVVLYFWLLS